MYQHKRQAAITPDLYSLDLGCQSKNLLSFSQTFQEYSDIITQQDRQCMYKRNIEARSHYHCRREKATIITYSENVSLVLVILHVMCMHHIMFLSVTCMGLDNIS
jgi:hypothetical protein